MLPCYHRFFLGPHSIPIFPIHFQTCFSLFSSLPFFGVLVSDLQINIIIGTILSSNSNHSSIRHYYFFFYPSVSPTLRSHFCCHLPVTNFPLLLSIYVYYTYFICPSIIVALMFDIPMHNLVPLKFSCILYFVSIVADPILVL